MSCSTFKRAIRLICGANNNNENNTDENKPGGGSVASPSFARSTPVVVFLPNTRRVRRQCWPFVTRRRFRQTRFIISGRPRFCPYIRAQNAVECTFAFAYGVDRNKRMWVEFRNEEDSPSNHKGVLYRSLCRNRGTKVKLDPIRIEKIV